MDEIDRAILAELQKDGRLSNQDLAALVGLTAAPCLRRVRKLEEMGVIKGYRAIVDQAALDRGFEVIVQADVGKNDGPTIAEFEQRVAAMPEVVELRRMFSRPDYFIRVRVRDSEHYEEWLTKGLLGNPGVARVDSRMTMKVIKSGE
ncbi:Lrp/AsnC family transcriptional regulator [Corynebacterium felinum]|uniref:DNA-binding Lrp family transcriptional regulator n=1 Tax=Corynebacterium felinum TaxID=131318 RepID=A0ABU2B8R1_9CORY|nr:MULTISPECIES: Lrp/AsnC family transcriptional regulator [Corynebacterium]MDF5821117.1 Lrp/AsnC family transcriptional regulator [Corynebacterium felinum]MDO4762678.1 Lrp/AsnC family transcriptional regulator [Corynebacterium sp.]MDR7354985.1 DNA-binding Lrp family transcriptional regulator [Corynebacterium felinum]WJY94341.1 Leucine-responsive regulatory protein [Corynebacterium felinum]